MSVETPGSFAYRNGYIAGEKFQREVAAASIEAAGCVCESLDPDQPDVTARWGESPDRVTPAPLVQHDKRCPRALAAKIRGQA